MLTIRKNLDARDILSKVSEEAVFMRFLGFFSWYKSYCNPLRYDQRPGCRFREKNNRVYFYDYSKGERYDCIDIVMQTQGVDFVGALEIISEEFQTGHIFKVPPRPDNSKEWTVEPQYKQWENEMNYWSEYYLDDYIVKYLYQTKPLEQLRVNGQIKYQHGFNSLAFSWEVMPRQYKFYFPNFSVKSKHYNAWMILGYDQLPETGNHLVITKSMKDIMVLTKLGINSVSPTSETILFEEDRIRELKQRFTHIFTLLDRDRTGMNFTNKWRKTYNTKPLLLFDSKDISDRIKKFGFRDTSSLIESAKNYYNI